MKRFAFTILIIAVFSIPAQAKYSGGTGESNDPYQIATKQDLLDLGGTTADYGKCFILTADVNLQGQVFITAIIASDGVFTGTFDGNGHKITHFTINGGSNWYLGLFGSISGGQIKNLGLENFAVSGTSGSQIVGGLVGENNGSISGCYSTGAVSGTSGSQIVGGLVGRNWFGGSISNCYSTGPVSGFAAVGGLVGENDGSISNCYSTGTTTGTSEVGGLAGRNDGSIGNCYSTSNVTSGGYSSKLGGLVGWNHHGNISQCYSTGSVSGSDYVGGLVGANDGSVSSSFWDTQTSGQPTSAGGTGKTTAQMKTLSTFTSASWDFVNIWGIGNGQTYPYLKPFNGINPADINYSGTVDFADFAIFAANWLSGE